MSRSMFEWMVDMGMNEYMCELMVLDRQMDRQTNDCPPIGYGFTCPKRVMVYIDTLEIPV